MKSLTRAALAGAVLTVAIAGPLAAETLRISHQWSTSDIRHRIIEIGCVELMNRRLTGNHYHVYINPDREVDKGAIEVHGITNESLADKPRFADIVDEFLDFVRGAELIIHNAPFDVGFLDAELARLGDLGVIAQVNEHWVATT